MLQVLGFVTLSLINPINPEPLALNPTGFGIYNPEPNLGIL